MKAIADLWIHPNQNTCVFGKLRENSVIHESCALSYHRTCNPCFGTDSLGHPPCIYTGMRMCFSVSNLSLVVMDKLPKYARRYLKLIPSCQNSYDYFPVDLLSNSTTFRSRYERAYISRKMKPHFYTKTKYPVVKSLEGYVDIKIYVDEDTQTMINVQNIHEACPRGFHLDDDLVLTNYPLSNNYALRTAHNIGLDLQMFYYEVSIVSSHLDAVWYV